MRERKDFLILVDSAAGRLNFCSLMSCPFPSLFLRLHVAQKNTHTVTTFPKEGRESKKKQDTDSQTLRSMRGRRGENLLDC